MCPGGGSSAPTPAPINIPDPAVAVQLQLDAEEKFRGEQATKEAEEQARFDQSLQDAIGVAQGTGQSAIAGRGLDISQFFPQIQGEIDRIRTTIPNLTAAPGSFFSPAAFEGVLDRERDASRTRALGQIDTFAPFGFEKDLIPNSADDDIIAQIIEEQFGQGSELLQNTRARGNFTDVGLGAAQQDLEGQRGGANATLSALAEAILGQGRQSLTDIANTGRQQANAGTLSQFFPAAPGTQLPQQAGQILNPDFVRELLPIGDPFNTETTPAVPGTPAIPGTSFGGSQIGSTAGVKGEQQPISGLIKTAPGGTLGTPGTPGTPETTRQVPNPDFIPGAPAQGEEFIPGPLTFPEATGPAPSSLIDPLSTQRKINQGVTDFTGGLEDRIRAVAPSDLFSTSTSLNRGGTAQGPQNVGGGSLFEVLASRESQRRQPRGLGTTGAF